MENLSETKQTSSGKRYARTSSAQGERNVLVMPAGKHVLQSAFIIIVEMSTALNDGKKILNIKSGLHCQWKRKVLISFDRMMLVNGKLIGDSWKTMSKLKNNSQENNPG